MKSTTILLSLGIITSLGMFYSCADDDLINGGDNSGDKGAAVSFTVSNAQDDAQKVMFASADGSTRAFGDEVTRLGFANALSMQGLQPADLTSQKLSVSGGNAGTCIIETTTPGIDAVKKSAVQTRANISEAIIDKFSSIGYRGSSATGIGTTPWFHNKETNANGTLVEDIRWTWEQPYGRFYGISPQVTSAYSKLTLSPDSYAGTPYVNFEVEQDVQKQKDLMTACSGMVQYATRFIAPTTNLAFRHALTAVRFKVGSNLSWNKTINKVEIIGAMSKGKYTMATDENGADAGWSEQSSPQTFTLGGDGTVNVSTSQDVNHIIMGNNGDNYTFYMIPQTLSGVQIKIYFADGSTPISANLSGTWKPGTTKTYALSQNTSTWDYQLTVGDPAAAEYNETTAYDYTVTSYREDPITHVQQPVKWKVVGYDANNDGTFSMSEKPAWITALSKEEGDGGTSVESGYATLTTNYMDLLAERNKALKDATPKGSAGNYYNLSNSTGTATVENTANSYVISAPGHYRIPLVYGNAIKDGADNPSSYKTSNSGTFILTNFKDHSGNDISSPYINVQNSSDPATQASLVWADESGLVDGLSVTKAGANSFVNFHVPADKIKNGNAVIAVKNADGTVMWSWHLWFAPKNVLNTTEVTNFQNKTYDFSNETLGFKYITWKVSAYRSPRSVKVKVEQTVGQSSGKQVGYITITQNDGKERQGYSTLYQFGRKDAFPGTDTTPDGSFNKNGGDNMSIQNCIQHPDIFYTYGASWNETPPTSYSYYNLWSMENTTTGYNDNAVVKTIYDPCPAGFKMPASNAFTGFTSEGHAYSKKNVSGAWDNGWDFYNKITSPTATLYFPASGYRYFGTGSLGDLGNMGFYWSSVPYELSTACLLTFYPEYVEPTSFNHRTYGFSVRPVSE